MITCVTHSQTETLKGTGSPCHYIFYLLEDGPLCRHRIRAKRVIFDNLFHFDQTTWELMWAGEAAMRKSIPALRQGGYEGIYNLPRIQQSYREKTLVVIPLAMRICATSKGEQRVQALIPVVQGLSQKQRQLMQQ